MNKFLVIILSLLAGNAWGATWYVRPAEGTYGTSDGTSYANAFDGFADVAWGVGQVNTGDTLKVCGAFVAADKDSSKGGVAMLSVEQAGVIIDGDCSASGDLEKTQLDGGGAVTYGMYCDTAAECQGQTWRNIQADNMTTRGHYVRNDLDDVDVVSFTGDNLGCKDTIGTEVSAPWCVAGFGASATLTGITSVRSTDDGVHWQGDNFLIDDWRIEFPGYNIAAGSNVGDCVQVITRTDNARIRNGYCDKRNANADGNVSKSCAVVGDPASGTSSEISNITCYLPTSGNAVFESKPILTSGPGAKIFGNYVSGGYYGIFAFGADSDIYSNIVVDAEREGISIPTTTPAGTTEVYNNTVDGARTCFILKGASASTNITARNNIAANCGLYGYEGFQATRTLSANRCDTNTPTCSNNAGTTTPTATDPQFVGGPYPATTEGFKPKATSPLIGAGSPLGAKYDYANKRCGNPSTIGAYCSSFRGSFSGRSTYVTR